MPDVFSGAGDDVAQFGTDDADGAGDVALHGLACGLGVSGGERAADVVVVVGRSSIR